MSYEIRQGDALTLLRDMDEGSVQCVVTSPPFWALRDYGCEGQLGLEPTPELYVAKMVEVFREVRRVLRDDGTLWLNLGDSYAGSWGAQSRGGPPKDLVGIPWRVAFALQADGWYLRSDIIWHKPNPMPESVADRPTKSHEYLFLLTKSKRYLYDAAAIAERASSDFGRGAIGRGAQDSARAVGCNGRQPQQDHSGWMGGDGVTRNRRTVWTITTEPFAEAHFATFPQALVEPCVLAGSKPGSLVLDPFAGSGTVGVVSLRHGRRFLGLELSPTYCAMARRRIAGPLFAEL